MVEQNDHSDTNQVDPDYKRKIWLERNKRFSLATGYILLLGSFCSVVYVFAFSEQKIPYIANALNTDSIDFLRNWTPPITQ